MTDQVKLESILQDIEPTTESVVAIDLEKIDPNPYQPRKDIMPEKVAELAQSIKANGLIQPIVVRRVAERYQLVVGERRCLACRSLGWGKIPAAVKTLSDNAMATIALIENLQRENLNYLEEAMGYVGLMRNFGFTQEVLAQRLGKSQSTIANKVRLLKLEDDIQKDLLQHELTERHARALLRLNDVATQRQLLREIVSRNLNVKQTEQRVAKLELETRGKQRDNKTKPVVRDMRIFLNTIKEAVAIIESAGIYPDVEETITDDYVEVKIKINKSMLGRPSAG